VRISLAPILDFFVNCYALRKNECFLEKKFLDSSTIEEAGVASAHFKCAQKSKLVAR
jgi:hypothetical protein